MHPIEKQLHLDHYHISRLLHCLQRNISTYQTEGAWSEHLALILEALDYIKVYPEHWHHPVEDKIFAHIVKSYPKYADIVRALHVEHAELERLTKQLNQLFEAIANDSVVPMDQLSRLTREFLTRQLVHIEQENELVYPLMSQCLSETDWSVLEQEIDEIQDPLFGEELREEYQLLHRYVMDADVELQRAASL